MGFFAHTMSTSSCICVRMSAIVSYLKDEVAACSVRVVSR